jgi:hypothetical protein
MAAPFAEALAKDQRVVAQADEIAGADRIDDVRGRVEAAGRS